VPAEAKLPASLTNLTWRGAEAGHAPQQETPEQFATLLEQFISDLG
jgi:hypothetical protein